MKAIPVRCVTLGATRHGNTTRPRLSYHYCATQPPSTSQEAPLTNLAAGEAR